MTLAVALAIAGCGSDAAPPDDEPSDPSAAASYRGYAAVQDDLYAAFIAPAAPFELYRYLGETGDELSGLVGRPVGFGVDYDVRNTKPNAMNVLVWRMMMRGFATDLVASCAGGPLALSARAAPIVHRLCAWPAVDDAALGAAWDLALGLRAPRASRDAWVAYARGLRELPAATALPLVWLGAFLHPAFLLEQ